MSSARQRVAKRFQLTGILPRQRIAFGRAYTQSEGGRVCIDHQREYLTAEELERVAHDYARRGRTVKVRHDGRPVGEMVESLVTTGDKAEAMGLPTGSDVAWWVGLHVTDSATWDRVEVGELAEISFGGDAIHTPTPAPEGAIWSDRIPEGERTQATKLEELEVNELSLVPRGAGLKVRLQVLKEDESMSVLSKIHFNAEALGLGPAKGPVLKALEAAESTKGKVAKAEVLTLADVQEALPEELWGVVLAALDQKAMEMPAPAAPPAPEAKMDPPAEPPAPPAEESEKEEEEEDPMRNPATKALEERVAKAEAALEAERQARKLADIRGEVAKAYDAVPVDHDALAELELARRAVAKSAEGTPVVLARETAEALAKGFEQAQKVLKESEAFRPLGSSRPGSETSALAEFEAEAKKVAKEHGIGLNAARLKVGQDNPSLARRAIQE